MIWHLYQSVLRFCTDSSFLLTHNVRARMWGPKHFGPCHLHRWPKLSSELLAEPWPTTADCWEVNQQIISVGPSGKTEQKHPRPTNYSSSNMDLSRLKSECHRFTPCWELQVRTICLPFPVFKWLRVYSLVCGRFLHLQNQQHYISFWLFCLPLCSLCPHG